VSAAPSATHSRQHAEWTRRSMRAHASLQDCDWSVGNRASAYLPVNPLRKQCSYLVARPRCSWRWRCRSDAGGGHPQMQTPRSVGPGRSRWGVPDDVLLSHGESALSSALSRFTVLFGMGRSGSNSLWSSDVKLETGNWRNPGVSSPQSEEVKGVSIVSLATRLWPVFQFPELKAIGSSRTVN
jgi:hypothetical protein